MYGKGNVRESSLQIAHAYWLRVAPHIRPCTLLFLRGVTGLYASVVAGFCGTSTAALPTLTHLALTMRATQPQAIIDEVLAGARQVLATSPNLAISVLAFDHANPHHPQQRQQLQWQWHIAGLRRTLSPVMRCPCASARSPPAGPALCISPTPHCGEASWMIAAALATKTKIKMQGSEQGTGRVCVHPDVV